MAVVYNDLYQAFNSESSTTFADTATLAYWAQRGESYGSIIQLSVSPGSSVNLAQASTIMSNWNGWDPEGGDGEESEPYQTDLTLELYKASKANGEFSIGEKVFSDTETHTIRGREIPGEENSAFAGNGTNFEVDWDLGDVDAQLDGGNYLFMVTVDALEGVESDAEIENDALKSLNIAVGGYDNPLNVTVGSDPDPYIYRVSEAKSEGELAKWFTAGDFEGFEDGALQPMLRLETAAEEVDEGAGPPDLQDIVPDFAWDNPGNTVIGGGGTGDDGEGFGDDGDQTLQGEDGVNNRIIGGEGDDQITGGNQNDRLNGGEGDETINGGDGQDRLGGDSGDDTLNGDGGDDVLWGNSGDDALNGGAGNDDLHGGAGDDRLTGGEDEDTFYYDGRGDDAITDFEVGVDSLELPGLGDATVEQTDGGLVLSFGDDQGTLTVLGVDSAADLGIA